MDNQEILNEEPTNEEPTNEEPTNEEPVVEDEPGAIKAGESYTDETSKVVYQAVSDSVLNVNSAGVVTGIKSGEVVANATDDSIKTTVNIDGTDAFDFSATAVDNVLKFTKDSIVIDYVAGEATYAKENVTFENGTEFVLNNDNIKVSEGKLVLADSKFTLDKDAKVEFAAEDHAVEFQASNESESAGFTVDDGVINATAAENEATINITKEEKVIETFNFKGSLGLDINKNGITLNKDTTVTYKEYSVSIGENSTEEKANTISYSFDSEDKLSFTFDKNSVLNLSKDTNEGDIQIIGDAVFANDAFTLKNGNAFNVTYEDGSKRETTVADENGGTLVLAGNDFISYTPSSEVGSLSLSVVYDDKNSVAADMTVKGEVKLGKDEILLAKDTNIGMSLDKDDKVISVTANEDEVLANVSIVKDGIKIESASEDDLSVQILSAETVVFDNVLFDGDGAVYKEGILTLADGASFKAVNKQLEDAEINVSTLDGTSTVNFSDAAAVVYAPGEKATLIFGDLFTMTAGSVTNNSEGFVFAADSNVVGDIPSDVSVTLATAGKYTLNSAEFTTSANNVSVEISDSNKVRFDVTAPVKYGEHSFSGSEGTEVVIDTDDETVSLKITKASDAVLDKRNFTLTENVESGVIVSNIEKGFKVLENVQYDSDGDITEAVVQEVTVDNDEDYAVLISGDGLETITGVSNGAVVEDVSKNYDETQDYSAAVKVYTDSTGTFTFGATTYTVKDDSNVLMTADFTTADGKVTEVVSLEGSVTGNFEGITNVNGYFVIVENKDTDTTFIASEDGLVVADLVDGAVVSVFYDTDVDVTMKDENLTFNDVAYVLEGDDDGVVIGGDNVITGLAADASLSIGSAGRYTINGTALKVAANDVVIGVTEKYAYIYDENNPQVTSDTATEDIVAGLGFNDDNLTTVGGALDATDTMVSLSGDSKNAVVIDDNVSVGEEDGLGVKLGDKGDLAVVEGTKTPVTVQSGKGDDTLTSKGEDVVFDMQNGGADQIIATGGNITLANYDPDTKAGIRLTTDDLKSGYKFAEGSVKLANAEVSFDDKFDNILNVYNVDGSMDKVGYVTEESKLVDASKTDDDVIIYGSSDHLDDVIDNATLLGGKGDDTIYVGGEGSYIDAGAGVNYVVLSGDGASTLNYSEGRTSVDNLNYLGNAEDDGDLIQTGNVSISGAKIVGDDVVLKTNNGRIQLIDGANSTFNFKNDYTGNDGVKFKVGGDTVEFDGVANAIWATDKNANLTVADIEEEEIEIKLDNSGSTTFFGDIKSIDASEFKGNANIVGNGRNNVITGSQGGSSIEGGAGNDTLIGGDGADTFVYNSGDGKDYIKNFVSFTGDNDDKADTIDLNNAAVSRVNVNGDDVILSVEEGKVTLEGVAGQTIQLQNEHTDGVVNVQFGNSISVNDDAKFYWATGEDAVVSLGSNYNNDKAVIDLTNSDFTDKDNLAFYGNIREVNASGFSGEVDIKGNDGNNILRAGKDDATLWGGAGNDTLFGGSGDDLFIYGLGDGKDSISGATDKDTIRLNESITLDDVVGGGGQIVGNNVVVDFKDGGSLVVNNAAKSGATFEVAGTSYFVNSEGEWEVSE